MEEEPIYHLNDMTMKYKTMAQTRRQHKYLGLPGEYISLFPNEIVFPNIDAGRVDSYYAATDDLLINLEEESEEVGDKTSSKLGKYAIFGDYFYSRKMYSAVICHKDPKKEFEYFERAPSIFIKIHYIYFEQSELWKKYDNIMKKVEQKHKLSEMEALDIAFIPKFISKENAPYIIDSLTSAFKAAIIEDKKLKMDIGIILGGMVLKHIKNKNRQIKLLERINMKQLKTDIEKLVQDEFGDELEAKDKEIEAKDKIINEQNKYKKETKSKLKELNELKDLNTPKAKQLIHSMLML